MPELAAHLERVARELAAAINNLDDMWLSDTFPTESVAKLLAAALAACAREARKEAIQETLAIYERAFAQNWLVQDTIDAIRALVEESNGQHV